MVQDMSSEKFPTIPRRPTALMNGWNGLINNNGRTGSDEILKGVFNPQATEAAEEATAEAQAPVEASPEE